MKGYRWFRNIGMKNRDILDAAILLLLCDTPSYGYSLMDRLSEFGISREQVEQGVIYRMLRGLEMRGYVSSEWKTEKECSPRRMYKITKAGKNFLRGWQKEAKRKVDQLQKIISKIEERMGEED